MKLTEKQFAELDRLMRELFPDTYGADAGTVPRKYRGIVLGAAPCVDSAAEARIAEFRKKRRGRKSEAAVFRPQCCAEARVRREPLTRDGWVPALEAALQNAKRTPDLSRLVSEYLGGRKPSEVYQKIGMSCQTFNNIRSCRGRGCHTKNKMLQLAIGLELALPEAEKLLAAAGLAFSDRDPVDVVVRFCIQNGPVDPIDVDGRLDHFGLPVLFSKA